MDIEKVLFVDLQGFGRLHTVDNSFDPGGVVNAIEEDDAGDAGFSSQNKGARLSTKVLKTTNIAVNSLRSFRGTITITTESGTTYAMQNARCVSETPLASGQVSLEYAAITRAQEVSA